jgi:hypothetical protein
VGNRVHLPTTEVEVEQGLLTLEEAEEKVRQAHMSVWGPEIWPENVKDIRDALADGPKREGWRAPETTNGEGAMSGEGASDGGAVLVSLSTVEPEDLRWLWEGR